MSKTLEQKKAHRQRLESKIADMKQHIKNGTYRWKLSDYNAELYFKEQELKALIIDIEQHEQSLCDAMDWKTYDAVQHLL